jgi:hypothetical protein
MPAIDLYFKTSGDASVRHAGTRPSATAVEVPLVRFGIHFTAVTSIDLDSVNYADGSNWQAPSAGACSVQPSMLMQVSETR